MTRTEIKKLHNIQDSALFLKDEKKFKKNKAFNSFKNLVQGQIVIIDSQSTQVSDLQKRIAKETLDSIIDIFKQSNNVAENEYNDSSLSERTKLVATIELTGEEIKKAIKTVRDFEGENKKVY